MNTFRNISSWFFLYFVGFLFLLSASTIALFQVVNPDGFKETLRDQNTYGKIIPAVLSTIQKDTADNPVNDAAGQLPLNEPGVQQAITNAFPASDLEQKGSTLIDSTFAWLEGGTEKPEFKLDFSANKQALGDEIAKYSETRLASLPRCPTNEIPADVDAFRIECLPFGASPSMLAGQVSTQIKNDEGFLKDPVVDSEQLSEGSVESTGEDPFAQLDGVRSVYQNKGLLMILLPILTLICAGFGIFIALDRRKAVKRLHRSFFAAAVGLLVLYAVLHFALSSALENVSKDEISQNILAPVLGDLTAKAEKVYLIFGLVGLGIGAGLVVAQRKLFAKTAKK